MRMVLFFIVFFLVLASANLYIYRRFLRKLTPPFNRYSVAIPVVLMLGEVIFFVDVMTGLIPESLTLYIVSSSFLGITFILFVVALVYDLTLTLSGKVPFDKDRRRAIKILFDVTMLIAAVSYLLRGIYQGAKSPELNTVKIKIKDFPFDEYSIVQLSDIHINRTIRREFIEELVTRTNKMKPDMVVITGDLVDMHITRIKHDLEPLKQLNAPVYFVLGNHEYFHDAPATVKHIRTLGIKPLLNDSVTIGKGIKSFNLIGINDLSGKRFGVFPHDIEEAYARVKKTRPCIVLAHQPKSIELIGNHRCDLMLSGHTHGGQIFPFGLLVMIAQPYISGLHQHDADKQIFVSRGAGYWGPPLRVLAPSEINRIVIKPV